MTSPAQKRVLFVDDDVALLELVKELMSRFAGDAWEVLTAPEVSKALVFLQQGRIDLLVVDIRMPLVDGLQFLGLLQRKHPNLTKVVLTGAATNEHRAASLGSGADLFLEKPRDEDGWRAIYAMLHELVMFQPEEGFRGVLRRVGLQDVLQMECLARSSGILRVRAGDQQGAVYIKDGQIIHAQTGGLTGEEAFNRLLSLVGGEFDLTPFAEPAARTITASWEFLLMEAARARDEQTEAGKDAPINENPFSQSSPTETAPSIPAIVPVIESRPQPVLAFDSARDPGGPIQVPDAPPDAEELLICSPQGAILQNCRCQNTAGRVGLLKYLSQKVQKLEHDLPLGKFDRLEVNGAEFRVIVQIQPDRASFVRMARDASAVKRPA